MAVQRLRQEMASLFEAARSYQPQVPALQPTLRPFIPGYIPHVAETEPFLSVCTFSQSLWFAHPINRRLLCRTAGECGLVFPVNARLCLHAVIHGWVHVLCEGVDDCWWIFLAAVAF